MRKVFDAIGRLLGGRAGPDFGVRWFGKLPSHADYVAARHPPGWAHEFANWLIGGFARYQAAPGGASAALPDSLGIVRLPESAMTVLFALRDFGGDARGRKFPFALFFGLPTDQHPGPLPPAFECYAHPIRELVRALPKVQSMLSKPDAGHRYEAGEARLAEAQDPSALRKMWSEVPLGTWYSGVTGAADESGAAQWVAAVQSWGDQISAHDSPSFQFNLKFPLAPASDWALQTTAWLSWLSRRARLDRRALTILIRLGGADATLNLLARTAVPDDFLLVSACAAQLSYMDSLPVTFDAASARSDDAAAPRDLAAFVTSGAELSGKSWFSRSTAERPPT